jgi:hypothetical protein
MKGHWNQVSCGKERVWVLEQSHEANCGLCCVGMAIYHFKKVQNTENSLTDLSRGVQKEDPQHKYNRATKDFAGAKPGVLNKAGVVEQDVDKPIGTFGPHLADMLNQRNLTAVYKEETQAGMKEAMRKVDNTHLRIVLIEWEGDDGLPSGSCHWVLVTGRPATHLFHKSTYTIHDPLGYAVRNFGSSKYICPKGRADFGATWLGKRMGFWVEVTGKIESELAVKEKGFSYF